jgi:hypothetical protein
LLAQNQVHVNQPKRWSSAVPQKNFNIQEGENMHVQEKWLPVIVVLLLSITVAPAAFGEAQHVRWDIISIDFTTTPITVSAGGVAFAKSPDGLSMKFTGSGTFVAPAGNRGGSGAVTGGGTWEIFSATNDSLASGTYRVTELVSFEFASFQTPGAVIDHIGNQAEAANGTAVVRIEYSDGSRGILTIGCHGPGAPPGIFEGIATTKGYVTFYEVEDPAPGVDMNRTLFHVPQ